MKSCPTCHTTFVPSNRSDQRHCSSTCRKKWSRTHGNADADWTEKQRVRQRERSRRFREKHPSALTLSDCLCGCGCGLLTNVSLQSVQRSGYVKGDPKRFRQGHFTNKDPYLKVEVLASGCWLWRGGRVRGGYGLISLRSPNRTNKVAHRYFYEKEIGPVPDGLELDHLCCNTSCVNPRHLEPVTHAENIRRYHEMKKQAPAVTGA